MAEALAEGQTVQRAEDGTFDQVELSSDRARMLAKLSHASRKQDAQEITDILIAAQSGDADDVEAANRVLLGALAGIIASGKPSSLPAIEGAARAVGAMVSLVKAPKDGERCPRCGEVKGAKVPVIVLSPEASEYARSIK